MVSKNPQEELKVLYREGLRECLFPPAAVERGLGMLESGRYVGFADVVASLQIYSRTGDRPHRVDRVVQQVSACEAVVAAKTARARAALAASEQAMDADDDRARRLDEILRCGREMQAVWEEMTPAEQDGKAPMRPHVAEAFRSAFGTEPPVRAAFSSSRPSWVGRAPAPGSRRLRESAGTLVLAERASRSTTTDQDVVPIQIIRPGWGSSGHYSREVLQKAAADRVIKAGTHMHIDHPSSSEREDRPERSVRTLAAVLTEDASWDEQRQALVAPARLLAPFAEELRAKAPHIGVSILGSATDIAMGEAEGRTGPIIQGLAKVDSIDFVTHAGREGRVLFEAGTGSRPHDLVESFKEFGLSAEAAKRAAAGR